MFFLLRKSLCLFDLLFFSPTKRYGLNHHLAHPSPRSPSQEIMRVIRILRAIKVVRLVGAVRFTQDLQRLGVVMVFEGWAVVVFQPNKRGLDVICLFAGWEFGF